MQRATHGSPVAYPPVKPTRLALAIRRHLALAATACVIAGAAQPAQAFDPVFELSSLDGSNGFVLNGIDGGDESGLSVSGAGDIDGDGVDDLIIGAKYADPNGGQSGESYVVFGELPCNVNIVSGVIEDSVASYEACDLLMIGSFIAEAGASITLSSGLNIVFEPDFLIEQGATMEANVCGQSLCEISASPMPDGCHSCVTAICDVDAACCDTAFDQACLDKVDTVCGLVCE